MSTNAFYIRSDLLTKSKIQMSVLINYLFIVTLHYVSLRIETELGQLKIITPEELIGLFVMN